MTLLVMIVGSPPPSLSSFVPRSPHLHCLGLCVGSGRCSGGNRSVTLHIREVEARGGLGSRLNGLGSCEFRHFLRRGEERDGFQRIRREGGEGRG